MAAGTGCGYLPAAITRPYQLRSHKAPPYSIGTHQDDLGAFRHAFLENASRTLPTRGDSLTLHAMPSVSLPAVTEID
jgi:hypothetical protein